MKTRGLLLILILLAISACEVHLAPSGLHVGPSDYVRGMVGIPADSDYYEDKARILVSKVTGAVGEYDINKVAVVDFVDEDGKVPILGEYMAGRVMEEVARRKSLRVAQKGDVKDVLTKLGLPKSQLYSKADLKKMGEALGSQAILTGKIMDLGTNIDVFVTLIDVASGEVIASTTGNLMRTKFAVEMLRHY